MIIMPSAARLNDAVTDGTITGNTSSNVNINGIPAAMINSVVTCYPPEGVATGRITSGSSTVFINGRQAARIGDTIVHTYGSGVVIGGSPNVIIGG